MLIRQDVDRLKGLRVLAVGGEAAGLETSFAPARQLHLVESAGSQAGSVRPLRHELEAIKNSTDVLLWRGRYRRFARGPYGHFRHARYLLIGATLGPGLLEAVAGMAVHMALGRVRFDGLYRLVGSTRTEWFFAFEITKRSLPGVRRYLSPVMAYEGLARALEEERVQYALLRWFDDLERLSPMEDLDFLVADADLVRFRDILETFPGTIPCDVYSESGLPGSDYRGMAYFPPERARELLDNTTRHLSRLRIPSKHSHFLSLAYHAAYHKGPLSGIPNDAGVPTPATIDHDYLGVLRDLAVHLEAEVPSTLEKIDKLLDRAGWKPPVDTLVRLSTGNEWIRACLPEQLEGRDEALRGLVSVFIRQRALDLGMVDRIVEAFAREGFSILAEANLDEGQRRAVSRGVRGSNWHSGPWPVGGGGPAVLVVAFDVMPLEPSTRDLSRHPTLDNARILCKERIRDEMNAGLERDSHSNLLHSSDNGTQAFEYLSLVDPALGEGIRSRMEDLAEDFVTYHPVLSNLTRNGRRAKVEVIDLNGTPAVQKTFRPGARRYLEREVRVLAEIGLGRPEIPPILERGSNYVTIPLYEEVPAQWRQRLLPLDVARAAIEVARFFYDQGYALVDFEPKNLLVGPSGLKVIDFEFLYEYESRPPSFADSYDMAGLPEGFLGDRPVGADCSYERSWYPHIGLSLDELLGDPVWIQHAKRTVFRLSTVPRRLARRFRRRLRSSRLGGLVKQAITNRSSRPGG